MGSRDCFACGQDNPIGLHLDFKCHDGYVECQLVLEQRFAGWNDIAHGGITATVLDEAASYVPYCMGFVTVTARLDIKYLSPIRVGEELTVQGRFVERRRQIIEADASIRDGSSDLKASARAKLMILGEHSDQEIDILEFLR